MQNKEDKIKWYHVLLFILFFIIMIPYCIFEFIKNRVTKNKRKKAAASNTRCMPRMHESTPPLLPFFEPIVPASDEEFASRISEFTCIQYTKFNGLSGESHAYQLIASEKPERKEQVLSFLKDHPIENLLHGDIIGTGCDMNHWEIRFIFEDRNLNRRICGYGITETSAPYVLDLISILRKDVDFNNRDYLRDQINKEINS